LRSSVLGFLFVPVIVGCVEYGVKKPLEGDVPPVDTTTPDLCIDYPTPAVEVGISEPCSVDDQGGFQPIVEWSYGAGRASRSTVAVGDLDKDGLPEIVTIMTGLLPTSTGDLVVLHGDGTEMWTVQDSLGFGSSPAIADLDGDGSPEIVVVREYQRSLFKKGDYTAVAFDAQGEFLWETEHYQGMDFDHASAPVISDMDHDGSPEIVVGRVIFRADGSTRGVGQYGRGSYGTAIIGEITLSEGAFSAVADIDLDGTQEVITGNAAYGPDGQTLWHDPNQYDAMIGIANLDDDPEAEFVASSFDTIRAVDTNGQVMWGPYPLENANIVSPPCIGDLDGDGDPEIVVAGGNRLMALHADGTVMWSAPVTDLSGASGASLFDFEGDGIPEVVYIDEIEMIAFDGLTGAEKFWSDEHSSDTMMDYPVVADVDGDHHAEIVIGHVGGDFALSVYGDRANSWTDARQVWNQHAYSISNVNDDLSLPSQQVEGFTVHNTWHSAIAIDDEPDGQATDLQAELLRVCPQECKEGSAATVLGRLLNRGDREVPAGIPMTLYAMVDGTPFVLDIQWTKDPVPAGWTSEPIAFLAYHQNSTIHADGLQLVADDDGPRDGILVECFEDNNVYEYVGTVCE
jgi:outer membrane protein assembly factor BamB